MSTRAWSRCTTCLAVHAPDWAGCAASAGKVSENTAKHHVAQPEPSVAPTKVKPGNATRCKTYRERHSDDYKAANRERMRRARSGTPA